MDFFEEYVDGDISRIEAKMPNFAKYTASSKEQAVSEIFLRYSSNNFNKIIGKQRICCKRNSFTNRY